MTEEVFNLDRETNIQNNIDALGKKWEVKRLRGQGLYYVRPNPDRENAVIPKNMQGKWTKADLLNEQIKKYLNDSWDQVDKAQKKSKLQTAEPKKEK